MTYEELNTKYGVSREFEGDDCEYEVTEKAMSSYKKYPYYKEWGAFLYGQTRKHYLNNARKLKDGYRGGLGYKGAYLLGNNENTQQVLTADILTSIRTLYKKLGGNIEEVVSGNNVRGEDIKKFILNEKFATHENVPENIKEFIRENMDDWDSVENIKYMLGNVFDVHIIN